jgi:hypothetical protein
MLSEFPDISCLLPMVYRVISWDETLSRTRKNDFGEIACFFAFDIDQK